MHPLYVKAVLVIVVPFIFLVAISLFWGLFRLIKRNTDFAKNMIVSVIIFTFLMLPTVINNSIRMLNCKDIFENGDTYLLADLDEKCWAGDHRFYTSLFAIPSIIFIVIGLPLIMILILYKKRYNLYEPYYFQRYGFIYCGL